MTARELSTGFFETSKCRNPKPLGPGTLSSADPSSPTRITDPSGLLWAVGQSNYDEIAPLRLPTFRDYFGPATAPSPAGTFCHSRRGQATQRQRFATVRLRGQIDGRLPTFRDYFGGLQGSRGSRQGAIGLPTFRDYFGAGYRPFGTTFTDLSGSLWGVFTDLSELVSPTFRDYFVAANPTRATLYNSRTLF